MSVPAYGMLPLHGEPQFLAKWQLVRCDSLVPRKHKKSGSLTPPAAFCVTSLAVVCGHMKLLLYQLQLQLQCLAQQSRATHKGARGSWGNRNKPITRQNINHTKPTTTQDKPFAMQLSICSPSAALELSAPSAFTHRTRPLQCIC